MWRILLAAIAFITTEAVALDSECTANTSKLTHKGSWSIWEVFGNDIWHMTSFWTTGGDGSSVTVNTLSSELTPIKFSHTDEYPVSPVTSGIWGASGKVELFDIEDNELVLESSESCTPQAITITPLVCNAISNSTTVLSANQAAQSYNCPHQMQRNQVTQSGVPVTVSDWTVLGPDKAVMRSSSAKHAQAMKRCIDSKHDNNPFQVVISHFNHPKNHRFMPTPRLAFSPDLREELSNIPVSDAMVALRIEITESEDINQIELLASTRYIPPNFFHALKQHIEIGYVDESRHRFSYYTIAEIVNGSIHVLSDQLTLPKCCGAEPCPPGSNTCELE